MNNLLGTPDYFGASDGSIGMLIYFLLAFYTGVILWILFIAAMLSLTFNTVKGLWERLKDE